MFDLEESVLVNKVIGKVRLQLKQSQPLGKRLNLGDSAGRWRKDTVWRTLFTFLIPNSHGFLCDKGLSWTVRKLLSESLQALIRVAWKKRVLGTSYDAAMDISRILFSQRASRHSCHAQRGLPIGSESLWLEPTEAWNTCQHHTGGYQTN